MNFEHLLSYCTLKGFVSNKTFIDVTPLGVQWRMIIEDDKLIGTIHYREINGTYILVGSAILVPFHGLQRTLSSEEILNLLNR